MHQIIHREKYERSARTKTEVAAIIGSYLRRAKASAKKILEIVYDTSEVDRAVPKRERGCETGGILGVRDETLNRGERFDNLAALVAMTTFTRVDKHGNNVKQFII